LLSQPGNISSDDFKNLESIFAERLAEVRNLKMLLQDQSTVHESPMPIGMSPTSMMVADEALARKYMEEMQLEEQKIADARAEKEEEHFKALRESESTCQICHDLSEDMQQVNCEHRICSSCLSLHVQTCISSEDYDCHIVCPVKHCGISLEQRHIKAVLSEDNFDQYLHKNIMATVEAEDSLIKCPSCSVVVEKLEGNSSGQNLAEQVGMTGKRLSGQAVKHCQDHRFRCRQCSTIFCASCSSVPYHIGFTCEEYKVYQTSSKCRYCDDVVERPSPVKLTDLAAKPENKIISTMAQRKITVGEGHPARQSVKALIEHFGAVEDTVCLNDDCRKVTEEACMKTLKCGHACFGIVTDCEHGCLPCLHPDCDKANGQEQDDFCNICWTESLRNQPCVRLDCGHVFHVNCVKDKLDAGRNSARIVFGYMECPLCKKHMNHPALREELKSHVVLYQKVKDKALQRLDFEKLADDAMIKKGGKFAGDPLGFAMKKFAYYPCFTCKQPYFGGHRACEALAEEEFNEKNKQEELICPPCTAGPGVSECKIHGKDFLDYKCKFCCSVAMWYCWGTTHFCDACHKKQGTPEAMTRKKKEDYSKCKGGSQCPLKIAYHASAGEEFVLGCSICRHSDGQF